MRWGRLQTAPALGAALLQRGAEMKTTRADSHGRGAIRRMVQHFSPDLIDSTRLKLLRCVSPARRSRAELSWAVTCAYRGGEAAQSTQRLVWIDGSGRRLEQQMRADAVSERCGGDGAERRRLTERRSTAAKAGGHQCPRADGRFVQLACRFKVQSPFVLLLKLAMPHGLRLIVAAVGQLRPFGRRARRG
jgi:hypothetical protein